MDLPQWFNKNVKFCPQCRKEFPLTVSHCRQCGGELLLKTVRVPLEQK